LASPPSDPFGSRSRPEDIVAPGLSLRPACFSYASSNAKPRPASQPAGRRGSALYLLLGLAPSAPHLQRWRLGKRNRGQSAQDPIHVQPSAAPPAAGQVVFHIFPWNGKAWRMSEHAHEVDVDGARARGPLRHPGPHGPKGGRLAPLIGRRRRPRRAFPSTMGPLGGPARLHSKRRAGLRLALYPFFSAPSTPPAARRACFRSSFELCGLAAVGPSRNQGRIPTLLFLPRRVCEVSLAFSSPPYVGAPSATARPGRGPSSRAQERASPPGPRAGAMRRRR